MKEKQRIVYACYHNISREGEQFVPEHIFSYQISGVLGINVNNRKYTRHAGDFLFHKRNELAKFEKHPPAGGEFKMLTILLDQETLRELSQEKGLTADVKYEGDAIIPLQADPLFKSFMDSLMPYMPLPQEEQAALFSLKIKEAVLLLLRVNPALKNILFDFSEPGKIDLEQFMQTNYHYNVSLERFAYLTGRSLATFKRDFEKIFHVSPSRWLLQRRLEEAYYQIKEKRKKPSEVYLEVGFENLSHFSYAFKNAYGVAPSLVN